MRLLFCCLLSLAACAPQRHQEAQATSSKSTLYETDPDHLWNRLHAALFIRMAPDGSAWGNDRVDPFLCRGVVEDQERRTLSVLDEFLEKHGETLIGNPLKRVMLQHDLWAAFDGTLEHDQWKAFRPTESLRAHLRALRVRIQVALRRLALLPEEIEKLPDTYTTAVNSREFPESYDPDHPESPFLPPDLFRSEGPWICLRSAIRDQPLAIEHSVMSSGRSAFLIFLRLPGGRKEGIEFLDKVNEKGKNAKDANLVSFPPLPAQSQVALVRQLLLVNDRGQVVPTRVTEEVSIRVFRGHSISVETAQSTFSQDVYQFTLSRVQLFKGASSGLRPRSLEEADLAASVLSNRHLDFVEEDEEIEPRFKTVKNGSMVTHAVLKSCAGCHSYPTWRFEGGGELSLHSVGSIARPHSGGTALPVGPAEPDWERNTVRDWKQTRLDWGVLKGFWEASTGPAPQSPRKER